MLSNIVHTLCPIIQLFISRLQPNLKLSLDVAFELFCLPLHLAGHPMCLPLCLAGHLVCLPLCLAGYLLCLGLRIGCRADTRYSLCLFSHGFCEVILLTRALERPYMLCIE